MTGNGVFRLQVNVNSGVVTSVEVQKSTGHKLLDDATINTLRRWRFKPHTVDGARVPIAFTLRAKTALDEANEIVAAATHDVVLYAPAPRYPLAALQTNKQGRGIYQLHIRPDGAVAEIKILRTTGNGSLDNRALATLRTWRFRPAAVAVVDIPVAFIRTANFYVVLIH